MMVVYDDDDDDDDDDDEDDVTMDHHYHHHHQPTLPTYDDDGLQKTHEMEVLLPNSCRGMIDIDDDGQLKSHD